MRALVRAAALYNAAGIVAPATSRLGCIFGLPRAVGRSHWELLTDAPHRPPQKLGAAET
jgi:hypothetical protein